MSNYPDDIYQYNDNPASPFYKEWRCPTCGYYEDESDCNEHWCDTKNCVHDD